MNAKSTYGLRLALLIAILFGAESASAQLRATCPPDRCSSISSHVIVQDGIDNREGNIGTGISIPAPTPRRSLVAILPVAGQINSGRVSPDLVSDSHPITESRPQRPQSDPALKRLIGTVYEGGLPIDGWEDLGGGLLTAPVWFSYYRRTDGTYLVLINWELPRRPGSQQATFQVTDVLVTPPLQSGLELSFDCRQAKQNVFQKIIAVIRPDPRNPRKWWRDVRQAWTVALDSGRLTPISPTGIECVNEGWGL